MKFCINCFREEHRVSVNSTAGDSTSRGVCDFCASRNAHLWEADLLAESFTPLVESYERVDGDDGLTLAEQFQLDWQIFSFDDPGKVHAFLNAVYDGEYEFVAEDPNARLRREDGEAAIDHVATWESLRGELIEINRYFPTALTPGSENWKFFAEMIESRKTEHGPGFEFFRARVCDSADGFAADEMLMPEPKHARAGRANPLGIPHLYLAEDHMTCLYECRAVLHNFVTVAKFVTKEPVVLLDLKSRKPLNPFRGMEGIAAAMLDLHRTIERLGRELQEPVRSTDSEVEYVPTQYLSALVKSLGMDGILYASSLNDGGTNAVLFDNAKVEIHPEVTVFEINKMDLGAARLSGPALG